MTEGKAMYMKVNDMTNIDDIWEENCYVNFRVADRHSIVIDADRRGYLSLARLFYTIADNGINVAEHGVSEDCYLMANYCGKIAETSAEVCLTVFNSQEDVEEYLKNNK